MLQQGVQCDWLGVHICLSVFGPKLEVGKIIREVERPVLKQLE